MRLFLIAIAGFYCAAAEAQVMPRLFKTSSAPESSEPSSNAAYPIVTANGSVYLGTDKGLNVTSNDGQSFRSDWGANGPTNSSISAIAVMGDTLAVAVAAPEVMVDGTPTDVGGGLYVSTDDGSAWNCEPQSTDSSSDTTVAYGHNILRALPVTVDVQNISYSLTFFGGYLYAADWAGGLRRSSDLGKTWHRVVLPPDTLNYISEDSTYHFQLSVLAGAITSETNYNQSCFSLFADGDSALYVGTAGGIDKTTDNGYSWHRFSHQIDPGLSGDWVVWLSAEDYQNDHTLWAASENANDPTEVRALSYSTDGGTNWHYILPGHFFHSVAAYGQTVYGASDDGLFITSNLGRTSRVVTNIFDPATGLSTLSQGFAAVATNGSSIWVGTDDGIAVGLDDGSGYGPATWHVFRTAASVANTDSTYFYPNPFSPVLDAGKIEYYVKTPGSLVTIRIFDFSMHVVRTILQSAIRGEGEEYVPWNGLDDTGNMVDNGVYFYSVSINNQSTAWGKIMVVR